MNCIDESTNTTTYLRLFVQGGLMRWHTVEDRATRGWFLFGLPHTTAVMRERASKLRYAVDSWFPTTACRLLFCRWTNGGGDGIHRPRGAAPCPSIGFSVHLPTLAGIGPLVLLRTCP